MNDFEQLIRDLVGIFPSSPDDVISEDPSALAQEFIDENDLDIQRLADLFKDKNFFDTSFRGVYILRQEHYTEVKDVYGFMYGDFYEYILHHGDTYLQLKAPYSSWSSIFWYFTKVTEVKPVTITTRAYIPVTEKETK